MALDARVAQRGILITPECEYGLIHLLGVEHFEPSERQPSMRSTAAIASGLSRMRRRVSLSTLTNSALSHLRASNVAEVPAMAMSRIPPASIWVMFAPS